MPKSLVSMDKIYWSFYMRQLENKKTQLDLCAELHKMAVADLRGLAGSEDETVDDPVSAGATWSVYLRPRAL